ncbi:hypothetical protein A7985_07555 [Pseudoalteromonas luteoviolacea]|uniref:DUF2247 family protein n=1 Tax=Pseudoalteromonas luteoviolacea TaxID=43657 RepID=A0A1C0TWT0_9GAMM|nr:hypothetical protein [Pseudoalteromonas luteoviolacea]OCQ23786.1 hypothetical protein A7985_07555 [Pseudoalteromonas luteoviolacea]
MNEKENEYYFVARYVVGTLNTDDLVNYANYKLNNGTFSEGLLNIVDAEPKCWEVVSSTFEKLIAPLPSFEDSVYLIIRFHLKIIASKEIDPFEQFSSLLSDLKYFDFHKNITKYVGDNVGLEMLYGLYYAVDDLEPNDNYGVTEIAVQMQEESKKWLQEH